MLDIVLMSLSLSIIDLTNKLTKKAIHRQIQLTKYISRLIAIRYDTLEPSKSPHFSQGRSGSLLTSSDQTTIRNLNGCALSILKNVKPGKFPIF